jgi:DNA-binding NtrC family response regulator
VKAKAVVSQATADQRAAAQDAARLRVLIVDDELLIRWSLREMLLERGCDVTEATDGRAAVQALSEAEQQPDVVLLDYRLPDSFDLQLLSTVREMVPDGQVILMTAFGTPEVVRDALALGAYRVVTKPFEMSEMAALVHQAHRAGSPGGRRNSAGG